MWSTEPAIIRAKLGNFDVVLDGFGPAAQEKSWKLLRKDGILLSLVAPPSPDAAAAHGVRAAMIQGHPTREALLEGNRLIAEEKLKITVARTFPVEAAAAAMAESAAGGVRGKLVIFF
jgi:NADPH:quinone reductase-like Zn-dependent oxidoreductase